MTDPKLCDGALSVYQFDAWRVRILDRDGEPWWVLRDVCEALGLERGARVAERLGEDEVRQAYIIDALGREQLTTIVNESGLYEVILRSDKPDAKRFRQWITHEVLPSIRKTGAYSVQPPAPPKLPKLPSGAQLRELRFLADKGRISGYQIQLILGVAEPRTPVLPEVPATVEEAAEAFSFIASRCPKAGLPAGALDRARRAAEAAALQSLRSSTSRATADATQYRFGEGFEP